jgi:hypothetical protein
MTPTRASSSSLLPGVGLPLVLPGPAMFAVCYGLARFGYGLFLPAFRTTPDTGARGRSHTSAAHVILGDRP